MDSHDFDTSLTPAGHARREAMLSDLLVSLRKRRARRRAVRAASVLILLAGGGAWLMLRPSISSTPIIPITPTPSPIAATPKQPVPELPVQDPPRIQTTIVQTDPTTAQRLSLIGAQAELAQTIGDDQLMDALVEAGRPAGLVRIGSRVTVVEPTESELTSPPPKTQGQLDRSPQPAIRLVHAAV